MQSVLHALDRQVRDFFLNCWASNYIHPIAWDSICLPIKLGGLGIKSFSATLNAALLRQVWNFILNKPTYQNLWVNAKYLRGRSFWDVPSPKVASWGYKGILALCMLALPNIKFFIGNGHKTRL